MVRSVGISGPCWRNASKVQAVELSFVGPVGPRSWRLLGSNGKYLGFPLQKQKDLKNKVIELVGFMENDGEHMMKLAGDHLISSV